jgi:hypothetical protein
VVGWEEFAAAAPEVLLAMPCLALLGDQDDFVPTVLAVSLYRALPDAELAVCPSLSHDGPTPERARVFARLI